ncbi:hypothetical protein, partial [Escherichia coli]|uniref:hypothetical protein n=1 Tax=Escherichia coli TaxID=562 RepID=UPI00374ED3EF
LDLVPCDLAVFAVQSLQIAVPAYLHPYLQQSFVPYEIYIVQYETTHANMFAYTHANNVSYDGVISH